MMEKIYLTAEDIAAQLGLNVSTVYRLAQKGELPGFKIGNQWRFHAGHVEEWARQQIKVRRDPGRKSA